MFGTRPGLLSDKHHKDMDKMLAEVLQAIADGKLSPVDAVPSFAQIIAAIDIGNIGEAEAWFKNSLEHFKVRL